MKLFLWSVLAKLHPMILGPSGQNTRVNYWMGISLMFEGLTFLLTIDKIF